MWEVSLLAAGLIFPTLSALTLLASLATRWRSGRFVSPVFIPCVGPLLLTGWLYVTGKSWWYLLLVWFSDVGSLALFAALPALLVEWWQYSVFTRLRTLVGSHDIQRVKLTLHRGSRYHLKKTWERSLGELGIVALSETGVYHEENGVLVLQSDHGLVRRLRPTDGAGFEVAEDVHQRPELKHYSLDGWRLTGR
ncbi:MAG: hypothetical protein U1A77_14450 [Pirellulales bacterium]